VSEQVSEREKLEAETAKMDVSRMTPRERIRYKARLRKRRQREHERRGIPSGIETRLRAEWKQNLAATAADPVEAEALRSRLFDFNHLRSQMQAAMSRLRRGIHPEAEGPGQFPDCIGQDILAHLRQYGGPVEFCPMWSVFMKYGKSEAAKVKAIDDLRTDPQFTYRMRYGLNIDSLWSLEVNEYFQTFAEFYLKYRDTDLDFDWDFSDELLLHEFQISKRYLTGVLGRSTKSVWVRLDKYRKGEPHGGQRQIALPIA
jgi:hypothetical protein